MPAPSCPEADFPDSKQFREAGSKSVLAEHDAGDFVYDLEPAPYGALHRSLWESRCGNIIEAAAASAPG
jgi:hypothetical protein